MFVLQKLITIFAQVKNTTILCKTCLRKYQTTLMKRINQELDPEIEAIIVGVHSMAKLKNVSCLVVDFTTREIVYQSRSLLYIDEAMPEDKHRNCLNPYWSYVREDVQEQLIRIKDDGLSCADWLSPADFRTHVCTTDFPIIIGEKQVFVHQEFSPLLMCQNGSIRLGLFVMSSSACEEIESYIETESGLILKYNFENNKYEKCKERFHLTSKEMSILRCLMKRKKTEEISQILGMAANTVRKHRRNIYAKLGAHSKDDVIIIANNYHLV